MKYKFEGSFISAVAETFQENALLLSTQGALQPEVINKAQVKVRRKYNPRSTPTEMEPLKQKLDSIQEGETTYIPPELSNLTRRFGSYIHYYMVTHQGKKTRVRKALEGGYNVTRIS